MPTLKIKGNNMIIYLEKLDDDVWGDESDEQTIVISTAYLAGFIMNHSSHIITLHLTIKGLHDYTIDFHRGGIDKKEGKRTYDEAIMYLTGGDIC
jgi:hypothetical protein